ncbi:hypothetical protein [Halorubrum ezzemoulense]|nr:hypothetical protein [Halorubrum ezzemoulense]MDB9251881.1 hypothetical protein [Halorubrum ezzemoulense]MDB9254515.1 hypothetical protein [Halorubrum ezzemoulense]MDB9275226.1 hypothetical protein [Halorubrum ezzemoulense]
MTCLAVRLSVAYAPRAFDADESIVRDAVDDVHARGSELRSRAGENG